MCPSSAAQDSNVRQEVVPTQMHRPPFARVSLMRSAVSWGMVQYSLCMGWSSMVSSFTGRKVPRPTWSVTYPIFTPLARIFSSSSGVKWSPAVGAAALPRTLEYTV